MEDQEEKRKRPRPTVSCDECASRHACLVYMPGNRVFDDCNGHRAEGQKEKTAVTEE